MEKYQNEKGKKKMCSCDQCKKLFPIEDGMLKQSKNANENGEAMDVTYFSCPHCDKVYIVSIIDKEARKRQRAHDASVKMLDNYRKLKKEVPEVELRRFAMTKESVSKHQDFLKAKYGKYFTLKKE